MNLLFRRKQTPGFIMRVRFKLWSRIELDRGEQAIVKRYHFDEAILIDIPQPNLFFDSFLGAFVIAIVGSFVFFDHGAPAIFSFILLGLGFAFWYYQHNRQTIYVRDLMHGRYFRCKSVVDLAHKEAHLEQIVGLLRQVMESAKNWDGTERHEIGALAPDEAKRFMLSKTYSVEGS